MKLKLCLMGLLCLFFTASAQQYTPIHELKLGDTIPDITISNVINYKSKSFKFSEFKGELVVLDFWASWCPSCITTMSSSVELQKKFGDKLKIILVNTKSTRDSPDKINAFFNKRKEVSSLSSVILDTTLIKMFPHHELPNYVWIQDNVVKAIAGDFELNESNINKLLAREKVTYKPTKRFRYDPDKLLFVDGNGGPNDQYLYRSIFTPYVDGLGCKSGYQITDEDYNLLTGGFITNSSIFQIYRFVFPEFAQIPTHRIIYRVKNPSDYALDSASQSFREKHWFTYQASFPARSRSEALKYMQQDIKRYISVKIDTEQRDTLSWVLKRNSKVRPAPVPPNTLSESNIDSKGNKSIFFNNNITRQLALVLEEKYKTPVIDETGYEDNISLKLPGNLYDIKAVQANLEKQGFLLSRERRKVNFIVLTEAGYDK